MLNLSTQGTYVLYKNELSNRTREYINATLAFGGNLFKNDGVEWNSISLQINGTQTSSTVMVSLSPILKTFSATSMGLNTYYVCDDYRFTDSGGNITFNASRDGQDLVTIIWTKASTIAGNQNIAKSVVFVLLMEIYLKEHGMGADDEIKNDDTDGDNDADDDDAHDGDVEGDGNGDDGDTHEDEGDENGDGNESEKGDENATIGEDWTEDEDERRKPRLPYVIASFLGLLGISLVLKRVKSKKKGRKNEKG